MAAKIRDHANVQSLYTSTEIVHDSSSSLFAVFCKMDPTLSSTKCPLRQVPADRRKLYFQWGLGKHCLFEYWVKEIQARTAPLEARGLSALPRIAEFGLERSASEPVLMPSIGKSASLTRIQWLTAAWEAKGKCACTGNNQ